MAMDAKRAADVLRNPSPWINEDAQAACKLGAEALKAWEVVAREGQSPWRMMGGRWQWIFQASDGRVIDGQGHTPLDAVLDAMEKEGKG